MINIIFFGQRFKIYANGKIKCLEKEPPKCLNILKDIIKDIDLFYGGPSDGFSVSRMAHLLPEHGVEVVSYRDYEMENAKPDTIY